MGRGRQDVARVNAMLARFPNAVADPAMNAPVAMKPEDGTEMSGRAFGAAGSVGGRGGSQHRDGRLRGGAQPRVWHLPRTPGPGARCRGDT